MGTPSLPFNFRTTSPLTTQKIADALIAHLRSEMDIAVLGLSGGADSTLVATLLCHALGPQNVYGVGMPYSALDTATFNNRSASLGSQLNLNYTHHAISEAVDALLNPVGAKVSNLQHGNTRARIRATLLYCTAGTLAEQNPGKRVRVVGTGNLSEAFIGYFTKYGDGACDIAPLGGLYKQEVYDLLTYFRDRGVIREEHIDRVPSAGLWNGQTDEDELGYSYNEMAPAIDWLLRAQASGQPDADITEKIALIRNTAEELKGTPQAINDTMIRFFTVVDFVWKRHLANRHKHMAPPVCVLPETL